MPKKMNSSGKMQNYVPAGHGDASGEYGDNATGSNKHYFATFASPNAPNFTTAKATVKPVKPKTDTKAAKKAAIEETLKQAYSEMINVNDGYKDLGDIDLFGNIESYGGGPYQIDNVLDALRYNYLPQVVDKDTFDLAVEKSGFIAKRGIGAPNKKVLDEYVNQLLDGDFYVNCSAGGAQYGQGMYCVGNYKGVVNQVIDDETSRYSNLHSGRGNQKVVTFTIAPDSKIINFGDIKEKAVELVKKDPEMATFLVKARCNKYDINYDNLSDNEKKLARQQIEYALTGDVVVNKTLKKAETPAIWNNSPNWFESAFKKIAVSAYTDSDFFAQELGLNCGCLAAAMGYDAIRAVGHGRTNNGVRDRDTDYTVILNRSKCIFLKE